MTKSAWGNGHFDKMSEEHPLCAICNKALYYAEEKRWRHLSYLNQEGDWIMPMTRCYDGPNESTPKATPHR